MSRIFRFVFLGLTAFMLQGCFVSVDPVLAPKDADYPFKSLVLENQGQTVTLVRKGDFYKYDEDEKDIAYLFHKIDDELYIAQAHGKNKKKESETLYAAIRITGKKLEMLVPLCDDADEKDLKAAGIERQDKWFVDQCNINSIEQMVTFAKIIRSKDIKSEEMKIISITQ